MEGEGEGVDHPVVAVAAGLLAIGTVVVLDLEKVALLHHHLGWRVVLVVVVVVVRLVMVVLLHLFPLLLLLLLLVLVLMLP